MTTITLSDRHEPERALRLAHRRLADWNHRRLRPSLPSDGWRDDLAEDAEMRRLEGEVVEQARVEAADAAARAPRDPRGFVAWFEELERTGPGQHDPLFDWLAEEATLDEMRWFLAQEVSGEAGFEDLVAWTQVQMPVRPKLELARNYWDEMGRGDARGMHGPMLSRLAAALDVEGIADPLTPALALANTMTAFATNRRYAYHSIGALGAVELTAPARAALVTDGLKRLDVAAKARQYFAVHAVLDVRHSQAWNREVIRPLVEADPDVAVAIAEGALMRLHCGARCFDAYREYLWRDRSAPPLRRAS